MSEAEPANPTPTSPAADARPAVDPSPKPAATRPGGGGKALAGLALVVGIAGLAVGGYGVMQLRQLDGYEQRLDELQGSADRTAQLAQRERDLASRVGRLEGLPSADELEERRRLLAALQSDMQNLNDRVEQVLGSSREEWRLAEAEHLLRMAMLRLSAMQDVASAKALVREADRILQRQDDPATFAVRQKLLEALEALRSLPDLDRTGLFLQLGALRGQASQLEALSPSFQPGQATSEDAGSSRWQRWLSELTRYVRVDFDAGHEVKPLLAGQTLAQVRLALSLAIEQAQWAVLNSNEEVYRQSIEQARSILKGHFTGDNSQSQGLIRRLEALSQRRVSVDLPDVAPALQALQRYVEKRQSPEAVLEQPASDAAKPEPAPSGAPPAAPRQQEQQAPEAGQRPAGAAQA